MDISAFFSSNGILAKAVKGYQPRQAQVEMATAIDTAIRENRHFIAEAGTGTGKTFAYLVPALLSGKKAIVSTGTKNLQDQLFNKDIPLLRKVFKTPFTAALLKGRSNYLCLLRLKNAMTTTFGFSKDDAMALAKINTWASRTQTGDISEIAGVEENNPIWYQATSTVGNCLGQECADYAQCFLVKARKKAQEADLIVVNHHLLCADWAIRDNGFGELLPSVGAVIIDEAHQLPETAANFLGINLSGRQFNELAQDSLVEFYQDATDIPELRATAENLEHAVRNLRLAFGIELKRGDWQELVKNKAVMDALHSLQTNLQQLTEQLKIASVKSKNLDVCFKRAEELSEQLQAIVTEQDSKWIRWYELHRQSFTLNRTPLTITNEFQQFMLLHKASWIFTSATLSVANSFEHFSSQLGLTDIPGASWSSPFDYANQSLFYHPKGLPHPNDPHFIPLILEFVVPVLEASQGRAFFFIH
ncbi:ATP-dependent DNA helicase [Methylocucumis oryzae]|uniref:ATP-dependent DNA helicase n=1 Tax=Methylocucumis oryzae TaxID=1632867 RepID=UPI000A4010E1